MQDNNFIIVRSAVSCKYIDMKNKLFILLLSLYQIYQKRTITIIYPFFFNSRIIIKNITNIDINKRFDKVTSYYLIFIYKICQNLKHVLQNIIRSLNDYNVI